MEGFGRAVVGLGDPPAELGVVGVVEPVPLGEVSEELVVEAGAAEGGELVVRFAGFEFLLEFGEVGFDLREGCGGELGLDGVAASLVLAELDEVDCEGEEGFGFVDLLLEGVELCEVAVEVVLEKEVVDALALVEFVEVLLF